MKRLFVSAAVAALFCAGRASIAENAQFGTDNPVVYHVPGTTVVIATHKRPILLIPNPTINYLDHLPIPASQRTGASLV